MKTLLHLLVTCGIVALVAQRASGSVSEADKTEILQVHNQCRRDVVPEARNMMKMYWNDALAGAAQDWADLCNYSHDSNDERTEAVGLSLTVGQNLYMTSDSAATWTMAVQNWDDEKQFLTYNASSTNVTGHYTQVVQDKATHVGCGYAHCPSQPVMKEFFVCNYVYGQYSTDEFIPYDEGTPCAVCPSQSCSDNQCDCGADTLLCQNNGILNPDTCECLCVPPYTGTQCEIAPTIDCSQDDEWPCYDPWPVAFCDIYSNVPTQCPVMCGKCP